MSRTVVQALLFAIWLAACGIKGPPRPPVPEPPPSPPPAATATPDAGHP